jgi:hypothetical protein
MLYEIASVLGLRAENCVLKKAEKNMSLSRQFKQGPTVPAIYASD